MNDIIDPNAWKVRASLRTLQRAVINGWDVPAEAKKDLPSMCLAIAMDSERPERDRLRAIEVLRAMERDNLEAAQALDRIERLDNGQSTENVATKITLSFDKGG